MRKFYVIAALCFFMLIPSRLFSQNSSTEDFVQQILVPKDIYVGDRVQLHYTFNSPIDFFALADSAVLEGDVLHLNPKSPAFVSPEESFTVNDVSLHRNGMSYTLVINFIPWHPGLIDFPEFDLNEYCRNAGLLVWPEKKSVLTENPSAENPESSTLPIENLVEYRLKIQSVTVLSLIENLGDTGIRPAISPRLLPGTTYIVWTLIIVGILILFAAGFALAKMRAIKEAYYNLKEYLGFMKNVHAAKRGLKKLSEDSCDDGEFAARWQKIVRNYLDYRFEVPFSSVTTKRIASVINAATGNMLGERQENAVMDIVSLFTRTDYIIFAQNSIDSRQLPLEDHQAAFSQGERSKIIEITESAIDGLEAKSTDEGEGL